MTYLLEFTHQALPKTPNQLLGASWYVRASHAQKWQRIIWRYTWHLRPLAPLPRAKVTYTRCSSASLDFDGLVGSFKAIGDALVKCGIIIDDSPQVIGQPTYVHEKAKRGQGAIKVKVEGV